jgi:hypothetical protein
MLDLTNKGWCVFGLRGSGKSWLVKHILDTTPNHRVYDPLNEHNGYKRYPPDDRASKDELNEYIQHVIIPTKPKLFVIDEANKYVTPKPTPLVPGVADLNDFARHWGISTGYVCRRMTQFHTDIIELSNIVFIFRLPGKNDFAYMESLFDGLGTTVRNLPPHHFVTLEDGTKVTVHAPIKPPKHPHKT